MRCGHMGCLTDTILNESAKRGASQFPRRTPILQSGYLLNESAKRGASQSELLGLPDGDLGPQRKCEAWSFAISPSESWKSIAPVPQRKCEAWSFAISRPTTRQSGSSSPQRKCEAWSFAMVSVFQPSEVSASPQRKCEAWSFAMVVYHGHQRPGASSTKVRSVELRNFIPDQYKAQVLHPQRKCEAWSFAIPLFSG